MDKEIAIKNALNNCLSEIENPNEKVFHGKIRSHFPLKNGHRALITSDKISAFDVVFGTIPFKGAVLNQLAVWWFQQMNELVPHHFISSPHPNISVVKDLKILPVEIIVRRYLTGSTQTSSWHAYQHLNREICGLTMPEGMKKNEQFPEPIITPTTKPSAESGLHDEAISREEILSQGLVSPEIWKKAEEYALKMFAHGTKIASEKGLILVDTKYEMGIDSEGNLIVADEVHTPDSSRFWLAKSYKNRLTQGLEPEGLSKEFFREILVSKGFDTNCKIDEINPSEWMTDDLRIQVSLKYLELYKKITGKDLDLGQQNIADSCAKWITEN